MSLNFVDSTLASGFSGFSGLGYSGFSGFSGSNGYSGQSGYSGASGQSGYSGFSGYSGWSGVSGFSAQGSSWVVSNEAELDMAVAALNLGGGGIIIVAGIINLTANKTYDLTNIIIRGDVRGHYYGSSSIRINFNGYKIILSGQSCTFEEIILQGTLTNPSATNSETLLLAAEGSGGYDARNYLFKWVQFRNCIGGTGTVGVIDLSGMNGGGYDKNVTIRFVGATLHTDNQYPGAPLVGLFVDFGTIATGTGSIVYAYMFVQNCTEGTWGGRSRYGAKNAGTGTRAWLWHDDTCQIAMSTGISQVSTIGMQPIQNLTAGASIGDDWVGSLLIFTCGAPFVFDLGVVGTNNNALPGWWIEFINASAQTMTLNVPSGVTMYWNGSSYSNTTVVMPTTYTKGHLSLISLTEWSLSFGDAGFSGISGISGFSGYSGTSGYSGQSGYSGVSGTSGFSGLSGFSARSACFLCLTPLSNEPPAASYATLNFRNEHPILEFDDTTDENAVWTRILPASYGGSGLNVKVIWAAATATTGNCRWEAAFERLDQGGTNLDILGFSGFVAPMSAGGVPDGTNGKLTYTVIGFSGGGNMGNVAAGEAFRIKVNRDANGTTGTDDMVGDAQMVAVEIQEQ